MALFGERRIGKTLLLFLVRDILNGDIAHYTQDLLDGTLQAGLAALRSKLPHCLPVFISLHDIDGDDAGAFVRLILRRLQAHTLLQSSALVTEPDQPVPPPSAPDNLPQLFARLHGALRGRQIVLLFDEVEVLLDDKFAQATQVFRHLRSAIQTHPHMLFVFAGAEDWHTRIKDRTSPLVGNVKPFYLKAAAPAEVENYLLGVPLRQAFPHTDMTGILRQVLEWTGGKLYYVQAIGSRLIGLSHFDAPWQEHITHQVHEDTQLQLADFYGKRDVVEQKILVLLCHQPGLTVPGVARRLGLSRQTVWDRIGDLESLDKVRKEGGEYQIVGSLIEEWGKKNRDLPIPSLWPQRLRWTGTWLAVLAAGWVFWYTHPASRSARFAFAEGDLRLTFPSSVETGEQGTWALAVHNTAGTALSVLQVTFFSEHAAFHQGGSSRVAMKDLESGETRHVTIPYTVHAEGTPGTLPVQVALHCAERAVSAQHVISLGTPSVSSAAVVDAVQFRFALPLCRLAVELAAATTRTVAWGHWRKARGGRQRAPMSLHPEEPARLASR